MNKILKFFIGFALLVLGLSMVIKNWDILAIMVKASGGIIIALIGLVIMFAAGLRR